MNLYLVAHNNESIVSGNKHRLRIKMRRIEEVLMTCMTLKRMQVLLCKSDEELNRAHIKPRIKRLIRLHHECRIGVVGNQSGLSLVYSEPLTAIERIYRRLKTTA